MSLRYALLGMLSIEPMTGYDLLEHFDKSAGVLWSASPGQIYPELRRMEELGLIVAKVAARGARAEKRVYSLTDQGMDELRSWSSAPIDYSPNRDPARLKVAYLDIASLDEAEGVLRTHIEHHRERLAFAEKERTKLELSGTRRLPLRRPEDRAKIVTFMRLVIDGLASTATAEIAWAERGLAAIARLRNGGDAGGDALQPIDQNVQS
jgi:PadR family transcriptional regulator AphA